MAGLMLTSLPLNTYYNHIISHGTIHSTSDQKSPYVILFPTRSLKAALTKNDSSTPLVVAGQGMEKSRNII